MVWRGLIVLVSIISESEKSTFDISCNQKMAAVNCTQSQRSGSGGADSMATRHTDAQVADGKMNLMVKDKTLIWGGSRQSQRTQKKEKDYGLVWQAPPKSSATSRQDREEQMQRGFGWKGSGLTVWHLFIIAFVTKDWDNECSGEGISFWRRTERFGEDQTGGKSRNWREIWLIQLS